MNVIGRIIVMLGWIIIGLPLALIWATLSATLSIKESKNTIASWWRILKEM